MTPYFKKNTAKQCILSRSMILSGFCILDYFSPEISCCEVILTQCSHFVRSSVEADGIEACHSCKTHVNKLSDQTRIQHMLYAVSTRTVCLWHNGKHLLSYRSFFFVWLNKSALSNDIMPVSQCHSTEKGKTYITHN